MFEVFTNSIVYPKNIINYHSKKGGFVFLYILVLVILMSISTFVFYISSKPQEITEANTGCEIVDNYLACTGTNYDVLNKYDIYDFDLHLLSESNQISEITNMGDFALILQGSTLLVVVGNQTVNSLNFLSTYGIDNLDQAVDILKFSIATAGISMGILSNLFILMFIILISTIPFLRFKKIISYKKIFKMLTFASTPMAFLFAIYNLINFDTLIFFVLMLFAYRSVFTLQKDLHLRVAGRDSGYAEKQEEDDQDFQEEDDQDFQDDYEENNDKENEDDL